MPERKGKGKLIRGVFPDAEAAAAAKRERRAKLRRAVRYWHKTKEPCEGPDGKVKPGVFAPPCPEHVQRRRAKPHCPRCDCEMLCARCGWESFCH